MSKKKTTVKKVEVVSQETLQQDLNAGAIAPVSVESDENVDYPEITDLYNQILGYVKVNKTTNAQGLVIVKEEISKKLRRYLTEHIPETDRIRISVVAVKDFPAFNKHLKFGWIIIDRNIDEDTYEKIKQQTRTLVRI